MDNKKHKWKEPTRREGGPSMTAKAVAARLGFTSVESVHILVRRGPEKNGLPGYIPSEDGVGWIRKTIPPLTDGEKAERQKLLSTLDENEIARLREEGDDRTKKILYKTHSGTEIMFYAEDVAQWERDHPILEKNRAPVSYTSEEKEIVLSMASKLESEAGHVVRTELMKRLAAQYGSKTWNTRSYKKIKAILDDAGISLPPSMPRDTTPRRRYSGRQSRAS